jgi:hypothetical protein
MIRKSLLPVKYIERNVLMAATEENLDCAGIFVRLFAEHDYEILWLNGHEIIEMANNEEQLTGERIMHFLVKNKEDDTSLRDVYSPWGEREGSAVIRRLTLHEAVHFLGRRAKFSMFLHPKSQAVRFVEKLNEGHELSEHHLADDIKRLIWRFGTD